MRIYKGLGWSFVTFGLTVLVTASAAAVCYKIQDAPCGPTGLCADYCEESATYCRYSRQISLNFIQPKCVQVMEGVRFTTCNEPTDGEPEPCYNYIKCRDTSTVVCPTNPNDYQCQVGTATLTSMKIEAELGSISCS